MPKLRMHFICVVGERSVSLRRCVEKHAGDIRSANADVSNDKGCEKLPAGRPRVPANVNRGRVSRPLRRG
jgi:hypothetical protein